MAAILTFSPSLSDRLTNRVRPSMTNALIEAPIRFLNQLPFDQLFTWLGSPIFERPLCRG
jgi:hypothetical protein